MNRRLQQFLELEQLTPARFADIMGVQRSGISHLLSGRNKPGYDFIQKFLTKFPNISADWLITGKGKPYKDQAGTDSAPLRTPDNVVNTVDNETDNSIFDNSYPLENAENGAAPVIHHVEKGVKRITIFYSDGSFEEFFPQR